MLNVEINAALNSSKRHSVKTVSPMEIYVMHLSFENLKVTFDIWSWPTQVKGLASYLLDYCSFNDLPDMIMRL